MVPTALFNTIQRNELKLCESNCGFFLFFLWSRFRTFWYHIQKSAKTGTIGKGPWLSPRQYTGEKLINLFFYDSWFWELVLRVFQNKRKNHRMLNPESFKWLHTHSTQYPNKRDSTRGVKAKKGRLISHHLPFLFFFYFYLFYTLGGINIKIKIFYGND